MNYRPNWKVKTEQCVRDAPTVDTMDSIDAKALGMRIIGPMRERASISVMPKQRLRLLD
jgi:hypothetical protein